MQNTAHVRAQLVSCNIKNGVVLQFELESDSKDALPQIAMMTRHFVELDITDEQMVMDIEDDAPVDGQIQADLDEPEEESEEPEADLDEPEDEGSIGEYYEVYEPRELPEPDYVTEAFDEDE